MSGNNGKRKHNPTSFGDVDPMALWKRLNPSIQEPGSTPPAYQSSIFRPATFHPPGYQPTFPPPGYQPTFPPYAQESGSTPTAFRPSSFRPHAYQPTAIQPYAQNPMFQSHMDILGILGPPPQQQQQQQSSPQQQQPQSSPQQSTQQQSTQHSSQQQSSQQQSTPQQSTQQQSTQDQEEQYHTVRRARRKYDQEVKYVGNKILIYPVGNGFLPSTDVASFVTTAIKTVFKNFYRTYKEMIEADGVKEEMFEVLSSNCTWEDHHKEDIEKNFFYAAKQRLRGMLCDARQEYELKHDPPLRPYRPGWIGDKVWKKLLDYWKTDETFLKRSAANKVNIKSSKGGNLHTQGCVSLISHAQQLINEKGPNTDINDIHKDTHTSKKTGGFVDHRSETTQKLYYKKIDEFLEKHPEYSNHDAIPGPIRREIFLEVTGHGKKNTKYGFGKLAPNVRYENLLHIPTPEERSRPVALPAAALAEIQRLTQELHAQREEQNRRDQQFQERLQMMQQMMQQEIGRVTEEQTRAMDQQRRDMSAYFRELVASSRNAPIGETDAHEDSTNSNNEGAN